MADEDFEIINGPVDLPVLEGQLWKRGQKGIIKTYKSRWFIYDDTSGYLRYFKNKADRLSQGAINLMKVISIELDEKGNGRRFNIKLPDRTYSLMAESEQSAQYWMEQLRSRKQIKPLQDPTDETTVAAVSDDEDAGENGFVEVKPMADFGMEDYLEQEKNRRKIAAIPSFFIATDEFATETPVELHDYTLVAPANQNTVAATSSPPTTTNPFAADTRAERTDRKSESRSDMTTSTTATRTAQQPPAKCMRCKESLDTLQVMQKELREKTEALAILQRELADIHRDNAVKDEALRKISSKLKEEQQAHMLQYEDSLAKEDLLDRLSLAQGALLHSDRMVEHVTNKLATAMEQICYYQSVIDGSVADQRTQADMWQTQLSASDRALAASEARNKELLEQLAHLHQEIRRR